ncbi:MAG: YfhO family protein [Oscillospiraceae bacterium]|nr:YfhO family protein [Oscillospiraceae bacterium]
MRNRKFLLAGLNHASAMFFTAILWTAALIIFKIYPFGERSILITDMSQQYIEYHAAFYDAVKNGDSLLFTWNSGLGMNFVGLFAYYLASPFTLIMFLFSRSSITEAVLLIISVKVAFSGLTFSAFLRRACKTKGLLNILFSSLYALSAYTVVYCFNLMWLDAVILLPLVILSLLNMLENRKTIPLIATLTLLFFSNFYTAFIVGLFTLLVLIALLWLQNQSFRKNLYIMLRFLGAAVMAAGLTAFITLPTVFALGDSQGSFSGDSLFFGFMTDPLSMLGKFTFGAYDSITDSGTPYTYCGILTFVLMPLWLLHGGIPKREKIAGGAMIGVLLFSMLFSLTDYLWHAAETPVWFPCRYSFVLIFVLITLAARALSTPGLTRLNILACFGISSGLILAVKIPELLFPDVCKTMVGNLWITLGGIAAYSLLLLFIVPGRYGFRRVALPLLALCVGAELIGNTVSIMNSLDGELQFSNRADYVSFMNKGEDIRAALKQVEGEEGSFYRVENTNARNANDGMSVGYHSLSHYSSFSHRDTFEFLNNCGIMCLSDYKIFRYYGSTTPLDAVLGVKYVFSQSERRAGYIPTGISAGGLPLWRNQYALPLAFFADKDILKLESEPAKPFKTLNSFLSALGGEPKSYYSPLEVTTYFDGKEIDVTGENYCIERSAELSFSINNPRRQHVLLYFNSNFNEFSPVYLNGRLLNTSGERLVRGVIELGELDPGEAVVSVSVPEGKHQISNVSAAAFEYYEFSELAFWLAQHSPDELTVSQDGWGQPLVSGRFIAPREGALFTSVPQDRGWSAHIDGKPVKTMAVGGAFVAVPVTAGEHSFSLHFKVPGLTAGIVISVITTILSIILILISIIKLPTNQAKRFNTALIISIQKRG